MAKVRKKEVKQMLDQSVLLDRLNIFYKKLNKSNPLLDISHTLYEKIMYDKTENVEYRGKALKDENIRFIARNDQYGFTIYLLLLQNKLKQFPILENYYATTDKNISAKIAEKSIDKNKIKEIIQLLTPNQEHYLQEVLKEKYFGKLLSKSYEGFNDYFAKVKGDNEKINSIFSFAELGLLNKYFDISQDMTLVEKNFFNKDFVNIADLSDTILLYTKDIWKEYSEINPNQVDVKISLDMPEDEFNDKLNKMCEMLNGKTKETWRKYILPLTEKVEYFDTNKYANQLLIDLNKSPEKLAVWTEEQLKQYEEKHNISLLNLDDITNELLYIMTSNDSDLG